MPFVTAHRRRLLLTLAIAFIVLIGLGTAWALPCPFCRWWNVDDATICQRCLKAVAWPEKPPRSHQASIVVRAGRDAGISGPDENRHPRQRDDLNTGADPVYRLGSGYAPTGFRYLIRFDIPEAFERAGKQMSEFSVSRATMIIRLVPGDDAREPVPIAVFPLTRPFEDGGGRWNYHHQQEGGVTWYRSTPDLQWVHAGGDFAFTPFALAKLPRVESGEVRIDVTALVALRFQSYQKTGVWDDPGFMLMRDPAWDVRCLNRRIYGFESAPGTDPTPNDRRVLSPELFIE